MKLSDIKNRANSNTTGKVTKLQPGRQIAVIRGIIDVSPQKVYGTNEVEDAVALLLDVNGQDLVKKITLKLSFGSGLSTLLAAANLDEDNEETSLSDLIGKPVCVDLLENKGRMDFYANQIEPLTEKDKPPLPLSKPTVFIEDAAKASLAEINKLPKEVKFLFQGRVKFRAQD